MMTVKQVIQHFAGTRPNFMYHAFPPNRDGRVRGWVEVTPRLYRRLIRWAARHDGWMLMYRRM